MRNATPPILKEGETLGREIHLKVDTRFASIVVTPKPDEVNDTNFPRNLHNAAELFLRVAMIEEAERLRATTIAMLDMYADSPDGKTGVLVGQACVCWSCGHCGLSKKQHTDDKKKKTPPPPCGNCGEVEQTNWLRLTKKDSSDDLPWIEIPPLSEKELTKKEELAEAAKRAEIEANVAAALKERIAAGAASDAEL
jgi:hypothetical protein